MATQVTVNDVTGITPYNIYLCDSAGGTCIYINEIESGDPTNQSRPVLKTAIRRPGIHR